MTLENILLDCKKQLNGALNHKKHPFRYFTLASISENGTPNLRTVVLREFNANKFQLSIFTDARSKKVEELKLNQNGKFFLLEYLETPLGLFLKLLQYHFSLKF